MSSTANAKKSPWLTIAIVLVAAGLIWRHGGDIKERFFPAATGDEESARPCTELASETLLVWENGSRNFVNPPYDASAWSVLRGNMKGRIKAAKRACRGDLDSARKGRELLSELDAIVSSLDAAISSGVPFTNETSKQLDRLEALSEEAKSLARQGK